MALEWRDEALDIHWFLTSEERELLYKKNTHCRLGFAVLLKYFQNEGRFPEHFDEVPRIVLAYLANQIDVPRCDLSDYSLNGRTAKRDRAEILQQLREADFRALTPLIYSHINPYGWFELDMDKRLPIDKLAA